MSISSVPQSARKRFVDTDLSFLAIEESRALGGPGSGNFGHAGRPGQVGGSASAVAAAIQRGDAHRVSEDEFVAYHKTGHIQSDAYKRYEAGDLDFIKRDEFDTLLDTRTINGETVEIRLQSESTKYVKYTEAAPDAERDRLYDEYEKAAAALGTTPMSAGIDLGRDSEQYQALQKVAKRWEDSGSTAVRDARGDLVYYSPEEMRERGLAPVAYTVGAFVGDKAVGYSGDEFGASGVYVARAYQRHGLGLTLLKTYLEKSGRLASGRKLGQMTTAGEELVRALHRRLVAEAKVRALGGPGSGNFGHAGRPGQVGGSSRGTGVKKSPPGGILEAIHAADGGFTYNAVTGEQPTTGFALSLHKDRERILDAKDVTVVDLAKYTLDNRDLLRLPGNYLGGWHNPTDGKAYLDVSTIVSSEAEAQRLGREAKQLAYFDLEHGRSVAIEDEHGLKAAAEYYWSERWAAYARRLDRARTTFSRSRAYRRRNRTGTSDPHTNDDADADLLITLGGPGSGHHGHGGGPGGPGNPGGSTTTTGAGSAAEHARLQAEAEAGIQALEALLPDAIADAEAEGEETNEWDELSPDVQSDAFYRFYEDRIESGVDVDTSYIDEDFKRDLEKDNDEIIADTEEGLNEVLTKEFLDEHPRLPLDDTYSQDVRGRQLDLQTLTVDDDEGAELVDLHELRFIDGDPLTEEQQAKVAKIWRERYEEKFDAALQDVYETQAYWEARDELEKQAIDEEWNSLDDAQKLEWVDEDKRISHVVDEVVEPRTWVTGLHGETGEDAELTKAISHELVRKRTEQLFEERAIQANADNLANNVWERWKGSSSNEQSLAFQIAASRELGTHHRLSAARVAEIEAKFGEQKMAALQAYARAQWETSQFVLQKAGYDQVQAYRGLMLEGHSVDTTSKIDISDGWSKTGYTKLPDISLQRAGLQSTTTKADVANNWNGVDVGSLADPRRVVLRVQVPSTSVMSLPVFGKNIHSEQEVVILGTKEPWQWDAWERRAPTFRDVPIGSSVEPRVEKPLKAAAQKLVIDLKAAAQKLVIDLQAEDADRRHWLTNVHEDRITSIQQARREKQREERREARREERRRIEERRRLTALGGPGSGNFGHAGRRGQVGGSAPHSSAPASSVLDRWQRGERWAPPQTDEEKNQAELALANPSPLARPAFVLGMDNDVKGETFRYVGAYGEEFTPAPLPKGVERGEQKACFKNASLLVMQRPDVTYAEGFASNKKTGLTFVHAWAVDAQNRVVDPTWSDGTTYFGVKYDREAYLKQLYTAKFYGVVGGEFTQAQKAMATGAPDLRAVKETAR